MQPCKSTQMQVRRAHVARTRQDVRGVVRVVRPHCRQEVGCRMLQYAAAHGYVAMSSCASTSSGTHTVWQHCRLSARPAASWCLHCTHMAQLSTSHRRAVLLACLPAPLVLSGPLSSAHEAPYQSSKHPLGNGIGRDAPEYCFDPQPGKGRRGRCKSGWERLYTDRRGGCLAPASRIPWHCPHDICMLMSSVNAEPARKNEDILLWQAHSGVGRHPATPGTPCAGFALQCSTSPGPSL